MNVSFRKRNNIRIDSDCVARCSKTLKIDYKITELLFSRGFNSEKSIEKFLYPNENDFHDPFLLKGMRETVDRLQVAIDNNETIVVYGDYDADGICASAILTQYLVSRGLNIYTHIPNRSSDGYGLSIESIEKVIDNISPDLILTCDCGISATNEIAHAFDLGVEVIVTDHHEVADEIPDCIIVNPKQTDCNYPINYLCGAGVALKVVHAMGGFDEMMKYLDLAAVATIADLVPLLDENRLIVQLGLKAKNRKSKGLIALLDDQKLSGDIVSSDIAFKIAPRINAAGRIGDAYRAFELVTSSDASRISELIAEINNDNNSRKVLCDELYAEAIVDIESEDLVNNRAIVLSHPSWEKGITGILAARISGEFNRPSFILVNSGDHYKGTCRSVKNINIYDLLSSVSDLLIEFGGHSQAAGFSIKKDKIDEFKLSVNEYLKSFDKECFMPIVDYDIDIEFDEIDLNFAKSLELLEPFGNSNTRPIFKAKANRLKVAPCKNNYRHTNITVNDKLNILAFNHYNSNQFLFGDDEKELALEISVNIFGRKESVKALLKAVSPTKLFINDDIARANFIKNISLPTTNKAVYTEYSDVELQYLVDESLHGTLYVAGCEKTYHSFMSKFAPKFSYQEFVYATVSNNYTRIMVSPNFDLTLNLANYSKIIFLDSPIGGVVQYINKRSKAKVYVPSENNNMEFLKSVTSLREEFIKYYEIFHKESGHESFNVFSFYNGIKSRNPSINAQQYIICLLVFHELKLIDFRSPRFGIKFNKGIKVELSNSPIYNYILDIGGGK